MRLKGRIETCSVVILIDTGNTHNFVDPTIITRAQLGVNVAVKVPIGQETVSEGRVNKLNLCIQDHVFTVEAYVLFLAGGDLVLGVSWLQTLGTTAWNFNELSMNFYVARISMIIKGL